MIDAKAAEYFFNGVAGHMLRENVSKLAQARPYQPQDVTLFDATIAENIARLSQSASSADIVRMAKMAGAHEMILKPSDGYNTRVNAQIGSLSGGQKQRQGWLWQCSGHR